MAISTWSEEKKNYVYQLCKYNAKKIWFFSLSSGKGQLLWDTNGGEEYDILMGFDKTNDYYVVMKAGKVRKQKSITFVHALENVNLKRLHKIEYAVQRTNRYSETLVIIPHTKIEDFCKSIDYYMKKGEEQ